MGAGRAAAARVRDPQLVELLLPGGVPPAPGQLVRFPQLADTLEHVARGNNHPQGQVQLLVDARDLGSNLREACDAPRFRVVMTTDVVQLDAAFPARVGAELAARGHRMGDPYAFTGATQMVRIHQGEAGVGPCTEAGVDHRLDGVALGW